MRWPFRRRRSPIPPAPRRPDLDAIVIGLDDHGIAFSGLSQAQLDAIESALLAGQVAHLEDTEKADD